MLSFKSSVFQKPAKFVERAVDKELLPIQPFVPVQTFEQDLVL